LSPHMWIMSTLMMTNIGGGFTFGYVSDRGNHEE
jgi:hypothetical protein